MKKLLLVLILVLPAVAVATHNDVAIDQEDMLESFSELMDELDDIERLNERNPNRGSRDRIYEKVKSMRRDLRRLRKTMRQSFSPSRRRFLLRLPIRCRHPTCPCPSRTSLR